MKLPFLRRRRPRPAPPFREPYDPTAPYGTSHRPTYATLIAETVGWLRHYGARLGPGPVTPERGFVAFSVHQDGQDPVTVHIGDTLVWDGTRVRLQDSAPKRQTTEEDPMLIKRGTGTITTPDDTGEQPVQHTASQFTEAEWESVLAEGEQDDDEE